MKPTNPKIRRYQVIIWVRNASRWGWFHFRRLNPKETCLACIYEWVLIVGPVEVRKWKKPHTPNCAECQHD